MVCSNCKQEGHTKSKCPGLTTPKEDCTIAIDLSEEVVAKLMKLKGICYDVFTELKKGHEEKVYQEGLCVELQQLGIQFTSEEPMPIMYKGAPLSGAHTLRLDVILRSYLPFIFELKAIRDALGPVHYWQVLRYMDYKKCDLGAVVNFTKSEAANAGLEIQFVVKHAGAPYVYDLKSGRGTPIPSSAPPLETEVAAIAPLPDSPRE